MKKIDFIGGNTRHCLLAMALPMVAAMFLNMMYNLVDSLWIGNLLGETAYAALTNSTPIILILTSIAMGATNGVSILLSQAIGSKNEKRTESLIVLCGCRLFYWSDRHIGNSASDDLKCFKYSGGNLCYGIQLFIHLCVRLSGDLFILLFRCGAAQFWKLYVSGHCHADDNHIKRDS